MVAHMTTSWTIFGFNLRKLSPIGGTPKERQHAFWVSIDHLYFEISQQLEVSYLLFSFALYISDDAVKITSELHDPHTLETITYEKKDNLIESIGVVPAKYPPNVKLNLFSQL